MTQDQISIKAQIEQCYEKTNNSYVDPLKVSLRTIDFIQATTRYEWLNLPDNIYSWYIEKLLYYRGSVLFFKRGGEFFTLPFAVRNGINLFGLPYVTQPLALNGEVFGDVILPVGLDGTTNDNSNKGVIIYAHTPQYSNDQTIPTLAMTKPLIDEIAKRLKYLDKNLVMSFISYIFRIDNDKQKDAIQNALNNLIDAEQLKAILAVTADPNIDNLATPREYLSQEIWQDITSYQNLRLTTLGIQNSGTFLKRERNTSTDYANMDAQAELVLKNGLELRKFACKQINEAFGLNIQVRLVQEFAGDRTEEYNENNSSENVNKEIVA